MNPIEAEIKRHQESWRLSKEEVEADPDYPNKKQILDRDQGALEALNELYVDLSNKGLLKSKRKVTV